MCNCYHHKQNAKNGLRYVCYGCRLYRKQNNTVDNPSCVRCKKALTTVDCRFEPPAFKNTKEWENLKDHWSNSH